MKKFGRIFCVLLVMVMTVAMMGAAQLSSGTELVAPEPEQSSGEVQPSASEEENVPSGGAEQTDGTGETQAGEAADDQETEPEALTPSDAEETEQNPIVSLATDADVVWEIEGFASTEDITFTYTGSSVNGKVEASLSEDAGYMPPTYSYSTSSGSSVSEPTNVGEYTVIATFVPEDSEDPEHPTVESTRHFKITAAELTLTINNVSRDYTGSNVVLVADEVTGTTQGEDVLESVTTNAVNKGTYTSSNLQATSWDIKDKNGNSVSDCYSINFGDGTLTVNSRDLKEAKITFEGASVVTYNGEVQKLVPEVWFGDQKIETDQGYTVEYEPEEPTVVGEVKVTVTGDGINLIGETPEEFYVYEIQPRDLKDDDVTTELEETSAPYDKKPKAITVEAVYKSTPLVEGTDYTVSFLRDNELIKDDDFFIRVGEITVRLTGQGNFQGEKDLTFTITPRDINEAEITVDPLEPQEYNGWDQKLEPVVKDGTETLEKGRDYIISYSDDTKNVGEITVTIEGCGNYSGKRTVTYEITPLPVTMTAIGSKNFGAVDPALPAPEKLLVNEQAPAGTGYFVTVEGIPEPDVNTFAALLDYTVAREVGELPGEYEITFATADYSKAGNYDVTFEPGVFTVLTDAAFAVTLDEKEITTHDAEANFTVTKSGDVELIDNLKDYVDIQMDICTTDVSPDNFVIESAEGEAPAIPPYVTPKENADDKKIIFELPTVTYLADETYEWTSGLPAGTKLKVKVTSRVDDTVAVPSDQAAVATVESSAAEVKSIYGDMEVKYAPGPTGIAFEEAAQTLLDKEAVIMVQPKKEDAANISNGDWVVLTVGGVSYVYCANDTAALGEDVSVTDGVLTLTLDQLKALAGVSGEEGEWFGINPAGTVTVTAVLRDNVNHISEKGSQVVAFDTGTQPSNQAVENRAEEITITLDEPVGNEQPVVEGSFGGSTPTITSNGTDVLTWTNIAEWKNYPSTLPHSGEVITITYRDRVGNEGTHTLNVVKSAAVTGNTIYVKPMTDQTVPSGKLNFYGETNVWEPLTVTIGEASFSVDPLAGGSVYDNSTKQWSVVVDLSQEQVNFPVGQPTSVSAAYDELNGGEASIVITYKDEAQEPVMGSEAVVGVTALWGYVESSASVMVDIRHADGTVTAVPASNVAVDQFGYFYARLNEALLKGDVVVVTTTDFCGNVRRIERAVEEQLRAGASAELLGANIIGRTQSGSMEHRFATPVDLAALSSNGSMELPILAYKGIEIGAVTISLDNQGRMNVRYTINASNFVPSGGMARLSSYTSKPDIEELVNGDHPVVVKDLKTATMGQLASMDVSANENEDGSYSGIVWLAAEFDVKMDVPSYVNRGGRSVNFYRWLTEKSQTETLLNAGYSEMSAYEKNVKYYNQYQRFESISRTY